MSTSRLPNIPALRKHQLLLEFASLKHATPPGVYVTIAPNDPTLWSAVVFVRSGPYASAVLRLQIRFPSSYPDLPPLVTFSTDVFHPLIVPLTTYTFSTNASSEDPVSATDEERLPPGGFSLRHGFPHWFGRAKRSEVTSNTSSRSVSVNGPAAGGGETVAPAAGNKNSDNNDNNNKPDEPSPDGNESESPDADPQAQPQNEIQVDQKETVADKPTETRTSVPVAILLNYIKSTFDDETVLDSLPLEAAGNPSAWHAWKAHQKDRSNNNNGRFFAPNAKRGSPQARLPGDWHWDGIWAKRVGHEVEASHSDATLFGSGGARGGTDELIRFSRLDDATFASVKDMIVPRVEAGGE